MDSILRLLSVFRIIDIKQEPTFKKSTPCVSYLISSKFTSFASLIMAFGANLKKSKVELSMLAFCASKAK